MSTLATRTRLAAVVVAGTLALAACGSDADSSPQPTDDPGTTEPGDAPPATQSPGTGESGTADLAFEPPVDGSILEIGYYGGFTTREFAFQSPPSLLITADAQAIRPAAVAEIFPGPLLPQHTIAELTPAGLQIVLDEIAASGLLADVDYPSDDFIADAATATAIVRTADDTFVHEAYALGFGPGADTGESPERAALADAIERLSDLDALVGDEIGPERPWVPDAYQLVADPIADLSGFDLDPRLVPWPADSGVMLAEATECVEVQRAAIGSLLDDADQLTFFTEGGVTYQVAARPAYPGRTC